ncbi:hypothetical protein PMAYCL1PPCAC_05180, partial [Pristionchus mayeri]
STWLNTWIILKLNDEPFFYFFYEWINGWPWIVSAHLFLVHHFYFVQNIDVLLLTFDRFSAIIAVEEDIKWWKRFYVYIVPIF